MNFRHLTRFCLSMGAFLTSYLAVPAATAAPHTFRLEVFPIRLIGYVGQDLKIGYSVPCGRELYGIIAADDGKGRLRLAAATKATAIACTSLPKERQLILPFLATDAFKTVSPLPVRRLVGRTTIAPITDVSVVAATKSAAKKPARDALTLDAVYEPHCGRPVGTLIRATSSKSIELAVVEDIGLTGVSDCPEAAKLQRITVLSSAALRRGLRVGVLAMPQKHLNRAFYLRLAPVVVQQPDSLRNLEALGGVEKTGASLTRASRNKHRRPTSENDSQDVRLAYQRACDEAPVGVVMSRPVLKADAQHRRYRAVKIGMLVARYYNHACGGNEKPEWRPIDSHALHIQIQPGWQLVAMQPTFDIDALKLKAPLDISRLPPGTSQSLEMAYFKGCDKPIGAVYSRDEAGHLAVAVLARRGSYSCKKAAGEVSLIQPFVSKRVRVVDLYPLKLKGLNAH